ncbi:hypothetical protein [Ramlibacter albus]|uniref:TIGR03016 family PEP-CTERM system-associated outer membrane protein n=1 Tax=Ramlibacter albus TaxID=2079448 RepID=A0A923M4X4_9BURK|nr:hypothetical protein [Ramlibacter albus]MBC5764025.1 hypothetical protein [Ramlibacter albus]
MRRGSRLLLALLAVAAAGGVAAQQERSPTSDARVAQPPPAEEGNEPGGFKGLFDFNWGGLPPIRTAGSLAYDLRASRAKGEASTMAHLFTGTFGARTYIYQPWFATVQASLRLTSAHTRTGAVDDPFAPHPATAGREQFASGNARIDVFPRSRFPFEVHVDRVDSRIDSGLSTGLDFRTTSIGMTQRYRPATGNWNVSAGYEHREQSGTGFRDTQDSLTADFGLRWKENDLSVGGSLSHARRRLVGESSDFRSLVARHSWSPVGPFSLNTTVNLTQTVDEFAGAPSDISVLQVSSVGLWHREGSPLSLSGAARAVVLRDDVTGHGIDNLSFTAGANYELTRNLRLTANGTVTTTRSSGAQAQGFSGSAGVSWQADTLNFAQFRYDRFATVNASVAASSGSQVEDETQGTVNAQAGHSVTRAWPLGSSSALSLTASQSLSVSRIESSLPAQAAQLASSRNSQRTALHMGSLTWTAGGDNKSLYARLTFSDSRELGGSHARFQLWNFQISGTIEFNRWRSLGGDFTLQRVAQRVGDHYLDAGTGLIPGETTGSTSASGEITYRDNRFLDMPGLRFTSRIKLAQDVLRQAGTLPSLPDRETRMWENRLDWSVGRLETGTLYRLSQVEGKRRDFLMFRVQRNFGD